VLKPIITSFDGDGNGETRKGARMEVSTQICIHVSIVKRASVNQEIVSDMNELTLD